MRMGFCGCLQNPMSHTCGLTAVKATQGKDETEVNWTDVNVFRIFL